MTDNPYGGPDLSSIREPGPVKLKIGQTLVIDVRNKTGELIKKLCITRTDRPYVYDLADAYNESLSESHRKGGMEYVVRDGQMRLQISPEWTRGHSKWLALDAEDQRQRMKDIRAQLSDREERDDRA